MPSVIKNIHKMGRTWSYSDPLTPNISSVYIWVYVNICGKCKEIPLSHSYEIALTIYGAVPLASQWGR